MRYASATKLNDDYMLNSFSIDTEAGAGPWGSWAITSETTTTLGHGADMWVMGGFIQDMWVLSWLWIVS